jgi:hypothetical protein
LPERELVFYLFDPQKNSSVSEFGADITIERSELAATCGEKPPAHRRSSLQASTGNPLRGSNTPGNLSWENHV